MESLSKMKCRAAIGFFVALAVVPPNWAFYLQQSFVSPGNIRTYQRPNIVKSSVVPCLGVGPPSRRTVAADRLAATSSKVRSTELSSSSSDSSGNGGSSGARGGKDEPYYTPADLDEYSAPWGISLNYQSTLNTYRIEAKRSNGELAGYTTGFYLGDLLHLDKVQIQRKASEYEPGAPNAPAPGTRDLPWTEKTSNLFQLGAVLGCAAVRYGWDRGAKRVELLAIRENEKQHSRLVRYYRIAGFRAEREVGEELSSLKDRLLWGAEGTLMTAAAEGFMTKWTPLMLNTTKKLASESSPAEEK